MLHKGDTKVTRQWRGSWAAPQGFWGHSCQLDSACHEPGFPPTDARVHHWNHQQPEPFLLWQCCARLDLPLVSHQAGYPGHPGAAPRGNHLPRQSLPPSIPGQSLGWGGFPPTLRTLGLHLHTRPVLTPFCFLSRLIGTPPKHRHHSLSPFVLPLSPCIWE